MKQCIRCMAALEDHDTTCFECGESQVVYDVHMDGSDCPEIDNLMATLENPPEMNDKMKEILSLDIENITVTINANKED